ncbi:hypothetical protein FOZ62_006655 [Perkinsus olseni]|uniref:Uncharacterized protein n=1 Tax=Perkinsus olseni TaxID=32597 RepID=A0A7J6SHL1_PEROL|nr:hypothetical protein FOZ62_006655 [Perkinsus olseni]
MPGVIFNTFLAMIAEPALRSLVAATVNYPTPPLLESGHYKVVDSDRKKTTDLKDLRVAIEKGASICYPVQNMLAMRSSRRFSPITEDLKRNCWRMEARSLMSLALNPAKQMKEVNKAFPTDFLNARVGNTLICQNKDDSVTLGFRIGKRRSSVYDDSYFNFFTMVREEATGQAVRDRQPPTLGRGPTANQKAGQRGAPQASSQARRESPSLSRKRNADDRITLESLSRPASPFRELSLEEIFPTNDHPEATRTETTQGPDAGKFRIYVTEQGEIRIYRAL